jgi:hypothetical protein
MLLEIDPVNTRSGRSNEKIENRSRITTQGTAIRRLGLAPACVDNTQTQIVSMVGSAQEKTDPSELERSALGALCRLGLKNPQAPLY